MQKRGQAEVLTTTLIFEVLAGFLVAGIMFYTLTTLNDRSALNKDFIEKDHSMLINTIRGMPGDVELEYDTKNFYWDKDRGYFVPKSGQWKVKITKKNGVITEEPFEVGNK